jgi:hypothetical protein
MGEVCTAFQLRVRKYRLRAFRSLGSHLVLLPAALIIDSKVRASVASFAGSDRLAQVPQARKASHGATLFRQLRRLIEWPNQGSLSPWVKMERRIGKVKIMLGRERESAELETEGRRVKTRFL